MKSRRLATLLTAVLIQCSPALAGTVWYVNGVSGSDNNNCLLVSAACKTIGHAVSLAVSGDSVRVAAGMYTENLNLGISLRLLGSGATTTVIDGGKTNNVITTSSGTNITLANLAIQGGSVVRGGGIYNAGTLTVTGCVVRGNYALFLGGGIYNAGTLTVTRSTVTGNSAASGSAFNGGGGIYNFGTLTIDKSTVSDNRAFSVARAAHGGGIFNAGTLMIRNTTVSGNSVGGATKAGGGIYNVGAVTISNGTVSGNSGVPGNDIYNLTGGVALLQNSIVSNKYSGNCKGTITSNGYNLSSDSTCNFNGTGDLNSTDPMLGPLQDNGGTTATMALPSGSPAVDAGNPNGCRDDKGHFLTTDQRGMPRPDHEDTVGCDMGAYESQSD